MMIPTVTSYNGTSFIEIGNNPSFSYPIKVDGVFCWPDQLTECLNNEHLINDCCESLYDENSWPEETVTVLGEFFLVVAFVILFTLLRVRLWRTVTKRNGIHYCGYYWILIIWDSLLGAFLSFLYCYVITDYIKVSVGSPRPIYYSLTLFGSVHRDQRQKLRSRNLLSILLSIHLFSFFSLLSLLLLLLLLLFNCR